ncbi:ribonuclease H-like domain-containing protein [Tanacetum coccineum]
MSTYLKNMAGYKHSQLKSKSYDEIQKLFDKEMKRVNTFVDMNSEVVKGNEHVEVEKDDQEEAEMKRHIEIVKDDEVAIDVIPFSTNPPVIVEYKIDKDGMMGYFKLIRADGSSKRYSSMINMLQSIDREDLETWKLVKAKHENTRPEEDYKRVLWVIVKIQKMNIKFRGGLLGLKDFKMILRVATAQIRSKTYQRRDKVLIVKPGTIRTVLSLAASRHWPVHQLDVKNAFLHGDLSKTVYMHQPLGFQDSSHPNYVCLLQRSLYGLKQAPRAWFQWFASYITRVGFHHSWCDSSLFIYHNGMDTTYLLLNVDDIVLTTSFSDLLHRIISSLHLEFAMTDLGSLNYFLGISVARDSSGMFLSQKKYAVEILERAGMVNCNPSRTPVDTESKLGTIGDVVSNPTMYQSLAGSLQYLTFTRLDICHMLYFHNF